MNIRHTLLGFAGVVLIAGAGSAFVGCSGDDNSNPNPGSGTDASVADSSSAPDSTTNNTDGGNNTPDTGTGSGEAGLILDGSCMPDAFPADAGCTPCSANPLLACASINVSCVPFDDTVVPDAPSL